MENSNMKNWVNKIYVDNFKSLYGKHSMTLKPITVLAGPNSTGKSSIVKSLLLLKQTLEAQYDPGPLLLNGANVKITSFEQIISKCKKGIDKKFSIGFGISDNSIVKIQYKKTRQSFKIQKLSIGGKSERLKSFSEDMKSEKAETLLPEDAKRVIKVLDGFNKYGKIGVKIQRNRCFLDYSIRVGEKEDYMFGNSFVEQDVKDLLRNIIHLTGFRGNPERLYPVTSVSDSFPGNFNTYVASLIYKWYVNKDPSITLLNKYLGKLGLTNIVVPELISDTQVELKVGRVFKNKAESNLVNIADVGFGVSQTLPILVALIAARENQTVYIEEPEIHLHPKAQFSLAEIFIEAANKGVKLIIETHSTILLLGLQILVAENKIDSKSVILHWFHRDGKGVTQIETANLDDKGAYGKWPEDFADTFLNAENRYLTAVETKIHNIHGQKSK